ncbi:MAG: dihydropyrimidinase [Clostridiales bacterium]
MDKLIKNGILVLPQGHSKGDLLLQGEKIKAVGKGTGGGPQGIDYNPLTTEVIDAEGCLVFPGFIDTHTHFQLNNGRFTSPDDFASGSRAAILGGTTAILDFATQNRGETLAQGLANWHAMAKDRTNCDYGFHMAISEWNQQISREIKEMAAAGVTSFKVYMAYDNLRLKDSEIFQIMKKVGEIGGILGCHCENGDLISCLTAELREKGEMDVRNHPRVRPAQVEAEAVYRYLTIAEMAGVPVNIVHLSSAQGLAVVEEARGRGQEVYVETCPQYLLLEDSRYELPPRQAAVYVFSPPLRKPADQQALWQAVAAGQVDTIGTDHCSFNIAGQKDQGLYDFIRIPNGIPGVGHRPQLLYTYGVAAGKINLETMARLLSENPAKLFGLYPRKGVLAPGSDADIVIWDPDKTGSIKAETQAHQVDNTPYEDFEVKGAVRAVYLRGRLAVDDKGLTEEGKGSYLARGKSLLFRQK